MVNGVICANGVNQYKPLPDDYTCLLFGVNIIIRNVLPEGTVSDRWDSVMKGTIKRVSKNWEISLQFDDVDGD